MCLVCVGCSASTSGTIVADGFAWLYVAIGSPPGCSEEDLTNKGSCYCATLSPTLSSNKEDQEDQQ